MLDADDILQNKLNDLENGISLEEVLQDLPEEAGEIKDLLHLVAAVRAVPHPEPIAENVIAQRRELLAAAVRDTIPVARRMEPKPARSIWDWLGANMRVATAAVGAFVLLMIAAAAVAGFWFANRNMDTARVAYTTGQVQIATNSEGTEWKNIAAGDTVRRGDRVRTMGASSATLAFYEGTHTYISANSDLVFSELNGSFGNKIQIKIDQKEGETWNKVTPLTGESSYFLVDTPSGTASVHGTSFSIIVSPNGQTQFLVNTGEVRVNNEDSEVTLMAGQATAAIPSGQIASPTYQFYTQGSLLGIDEASGHWNVSGVEFSVHEETVINDSPQLGDTVQVYGRIVDNNTRIADSIEIAPDSAQTASFTGLLEHQGDFWQIGSQQVFVNEQTELDTQLALNQPVKVTFSILENGDWLASKIEALIEDPDSPLPSPTATADPQAMPSYEFSQDEIETASCGARSFTLTGTLQNSASEAKDFAANVQLGYVIDRGGEYVNLVELTPASWTRIEAGQTVTFNIRVTLNEQWAEGQTEEEVKLRIFVASATNRPDHLNGRLTVTISGGCEQAPERSDTPSDTTSTLTPEDAAEPAAEPTETTAAEESGQCTGVNPHPTAKKLSQRYGTTVDEIMYWFCQNYGFGEIDLAYSLSRQTGKPVAEIFAMRASGMGWGEINQLLLGGSTDDKQPDIKNDKPANDDSSDSNKDRDKNDKNDKPDKKKP